MERWLMLNMIINYTILILLSITLLFIPYSLLYKKEALQIRGELGITLPKPLKLMLEINILISIFVSLVILLLLVFSR